MANSTTAEETLQFARALAGDGVDALNVGIGWHESSIPTVQHLVPSGIWVPYAGAVKTAVGDLPVIASNRLNSLQRAEEVLAARSVDFISMARPFLADSQIVAKASRRPSAISSTPASRAIKPASISRLLDVPVSCMVNPRAVPRTRVSRGRRRCRSAEAFCRHRGGTGRHGKRACLGGARTSRRAFRSARRNRRPVPNGAPHTRANAISARRSATSRTSSRRLGVEIRLNSWSKRRNVLSGFDGVVLATGVDSTARYAVEGNDMPHVVSYADVLLHGCAVGERVAIVGAGGIGVDVAHFLSFGEANVDDSTRFLFEQGLAAPPNGAILITGRKARRPDATGRRRSGKASERRRVGRSYAHCARLASRRCPTSPTNASLPAGSKCGCRTAALRTIEADTVVIAAGQERNDALLEPIRTLGVPFRVIGGAKEASELNAVRAFEDGLRAAHELARDLSLAPQLRSKAERRERQSRQRPASLLEHLRSRL